MALFAASIFLSAFLLFLVQPLIARVILPWFGGSAAVWTTCLMFFQITLLAGYGYANASIRLLKPKAQAILHLVLLALSVLALPILPGPGWKPADGLHPETRIVALLAVTVGIPYLVLSTTGPLLQGWFARRYPGVSPYRLYALSNAGSLIALLSYPLLIEPMTRLRAQAYGWSGAYVGFAILCAVAAWTSRGSAGSSAPSHEAGAREQEDGDAPSAGTRVLWVALAFCPSTLLVAVTSHMTQNIAPVPLLWVVPLALYLVSFILTFESERWYGRRFWFPLFIVAASLMLGFLFPEGPSPSLKVVIPVFTLGFFICAMMCHGELYRLRPSPRWLTSFYFMVSLGGALGGVFVGVIAPLIFRFYLELPIGLMVTAIMIGLVLRRAAPSLPGPSARLIEYSLVSALICGFLYLFAWELPKWARQFRLMERNFYGAVRVQEIPATADTEPMRELDHGTINHGSEFIREPFRRNPTTYYGPTSGIGVALRNVPGIPPRKVGIIGLGAGTISAYARPGDTFRFYEINPGVVDIAKTQFYFLQECPAKLEVVLGDGRLSLEREQPQGYDVLAVDAFSGDSIPVHLLTREAFDEYFRHLKPSGLLAIHVSNKYLDLAKVVARIAADMHKSAALIANAEDDNAGVYSSDWVMLSNEASTLDHAEWKTTDREPLPSPEPNLWTDDYSNLFRILK